MFKWLNWFKFWKKEPLPELDLEFELWAFGKIISEVYIQDIPVLWNSLHGDILHINKNESLHKSLNKMMDLYKMHTCKEMVKNANAKDQCVD